ncbi:MAG TPA: ABC transporter substrate-binding protein, partial [Chloroflexota bacterium]
DNPLVRRAVHLASNRQNYFKSWETGEPIFLSRWMPNGSPYATPVEQIEKMPGYRPDKTEDIATARKLMAEAGYPNGFDGVDLVTPEVALWAQVSAPAFQEDLKKALNIGSKIRIVERGVLSEAYQKGDFGVLLESGYSSGQFDPTVLWTTNLKTGASSNWARYSNPALDKLIEQVNVEMDETKRRALFAQGMDMLDENPPFYMIGFCNHSPMWNKRVRGLNLDGEGPIKRSYSDFGRVDTAWIDK